MAVDRPAGRLRGLSLFTVAALGVLVALVVASVLLWFRVQDAAAVEDDREAALHAARQEAVNFATIDHRHVKRDFGRILSGATGPFEKEFSSGTDQLSSLLTKNDTVSTGEVVEAGVVSADADNARVLVVVDADVRNAEQPKGTMRHYRMRMDLVRKEGRWLTSQLEFVG